jgi:hypothetical protein
MKRPFRSLTTHTLCFVISAVFGGCSIDLRTFVVEEAGVVETDVADVVVKRDNGSEMFEVGFDGVGEEVRFFDVTVDAIDATSGMDRVAPDAVVCTPPEMTCGEGCVSLSTSHEHCGACGIRCSADEACVFGTCLVSGMVVSTAGRLCTRPGTMGGRDPACGVELSCFPTASMPTCSRRCTDQTTQTAERAMCGGAGSTCLSFGDGADRDSWCAKACSPDAPARTAGACDRGFVCTGWWYSHGGGRSDVRGCAPFCSTDADCVAGERCNPRRGECGVRLPSALQAPDGMPCNPTVTVFVAEENINRNVQCRGECFEVVGASPMQGICGSYLNLSVTSVCPDSPGIIMPTKSNDADNLALCVERTCRSNATCTRPLVCRYPEDATGRPLMTEPSVCNYPTAAQAVGIR